MSNRKRIFLHIGANKTGSSAIQQSLALNHHRLQEEGFIVPNAKLQIADKIEGWHVWAIQSYLTQDEGRSQLEVDIKRIADSTSDAHTIILTAENLAAGPRAPALFAGLVDTYDLRVLLYIRRQDEFLLSSWQQWHSKTSSDFWCWAINNLGTLGNWRTYLQMWETVVPRENIAVRVYEKARLVGGDAVADFFGQVGSRIPVEEIERPNGTVNASYSDAIMDLVKGNNLIFANAHDNDFYNFVQTFTGDRFQRQKRESIITFNQRQAILGRYAECNQWVRNNYFGEKPLFTPPQEADYDYLTPEAMTRKQLEFLVTMMYRMRKEKKA